MKKVLRQAVKKYMYRKQKDEKRSVSTQELVSHINEHYAFGTSVNEIINILGKDKDILKMEVIAIKGRGHGSYTGQSWTTAPHWIPKKNAYHKAHRDLAERRENRRKMLMDREMKPCNLRQQPEEPISNNPSSS